MKIRPRFIFFYNLIFHIQNRENYHKNTKMIFRSTQIILLNGQKNGYTVQRKLHVHRDIECGAKRLVVTWDKIK